MRQLINFISSFVLLSSIILKPNIYAFQNSITEKFIDNPEDFKTYLITNDQTLNISNSTDFSKVNLILISTIREKYAGEVYFLRSFSNSSDLMSLKEKLGFQSLNTPRRITGLAYSFFVPGSGQFYLGHKTKGALFAVTFFTGLVGAVVSQNNFIGNRERIQSLQFEYLNADRYTLAEYYWKQMVSVHDEQKMHEKTRNIFTAATILVWSLNLVDYIFFSDDKGSVEFSSLQQSTNNNYNLVSISIPLR